MVSSIIIDAARLEIRLKLDATGTTPAPLLVPWPAPLRQRRRGVVGTSEGTDIRPIRSETRARLLQNIADGRAWLAELVLGRTPDIRTIADREGYSEKHIRTTLNLAFLAPDLVRAAVAGTLPAGIGVVRLGEASVNWAEQHAAFVPYRAYGHG